MTEVNQTTKQLALNKLGAEFKSLAAIINEETRLTPVKLEEAAVLVASVQVYLAFLLNRYVPDGRNIEAELITEEVEKRAAESKANFTDSQWLASLPPETVAQLRKTLEKR